MRGRDAGRLQSLDAPHRSFAFGDQLEVAQERADLLVNPAQRDRGEGGPHAAAFVSRSTAQATSGLRSSQRTLPSVAFSMAGQYSAGTFPRLFQLETALCTTPTASPSFAVLPSNSIALSSALMPPLKHERVSRVNTFVTGSEALITSVREPLDTVAKRLKFARLKKEWSQGQLADLAGVAQSTIGNIEAGIRLSPGSQPQIADALGVRLKWLRDGEGEMEAGTSTPELTETDFAMLQAFQDMASEDREAMLKDALEKAERFRRLAKEAISRHTSAETAAHDAFRPKAKPPSEVYKKPPHRRLNVTAAKKRGKAA
jgi:transcriptional regulator with XRE-family HTH domain